MKRIFKIITSAFIICLIPFSMIAGQEKKTEKKIKIVVADGSGTKVIIDTLIKDGQMNDSIMLKDGKGPGENIIIINNGKVIEKEGGETFTYTIKSDRKESEVERTKYVIHKDGMLISVEGTDYEKVKELVKEIESKLDEK
jgi:hypothetical protein